MNSGSTVELTDLLVAWGSGDSQAAEHLLPLVYGELRKLAKSHLSRERSGHTLQPTALVHEAFLRLFDQKTVCWRNRCHFFGLAGSMMRRILVDYARHRRRDKRGGRDVRVDLEEAGGVTFGPAPDILELDVALRDLAVIDPKKAKVVELHFFAGLSVEETAEALQCSTATVTRHWRMAKAWLFRELNHAA